MKYHNMYIIQGIYRLDEPTGMGSYFEDNDNFYDGAWVNGKKEGYGTLTKNGSKYYEGNFKEDLKEGKGILFYEDGTIHYDGEFVNDYRQGINKKNNDLGQGKQNYSSGKLQYEGEFFDDDQEGKGTLYDEENNKMYEGYWSKSMKNGFGVWYVDDMAEYEGEWQIDM